MKKIFLFATLLFQLTFVFGQNKDCPESSICNGASGIKRCWGVVRTFDQGLQIRVKGPIENCYNAINSEPNRHSFMWHIEISGLKRVKQDCKLYVTGGDTRKGDYLIGNNTEGTVLTDKMTVDFFTFSNAETIGLEVLLFGNTSTNKNSNQQTTQQNDLTEYNRSKADLERQMAEKNAEGQQKSQNYTIAMNAGISAHNLGNYAEAKRQFSIALNNCNTEEAKQIAQEYYSKSVDAEKSQAKIKAVGDLTTATVDLISYLSNRKNALRNSLSQEDGQALIDIANSENPADYTQNIIQIFTDLGYTYRKTEKDNYGTTITMNNDVANINDFMLIFIRSASYSDYNSIGFSYHRKEKLLSQLSVLGNKLEGYKFPEIKGVPPSRREKVDAIVGKQEAEKEKKEQNVIEINKWVKDFNITNSDIEISDNITVEEIINRSIEATGGIQKLKEVQNVVINKDYGDGYNHKIIIAYGKYISTTTYSNGKAYSKNVLVGKKGYRIFLEDKKKLIESEKQELSKKEPIDILGIQKLELKKGKILKFNSKDCYTLINEERATFGENLFYVNTYFFDIKSGLLVGKTQHFNTKPNDNKYEVYDEYKNVDGILFHTKEISFYESDKNSTAIIDGKLRKNAFISELSIKINQNITDKDFE